MTGINSKLSLFLAVLLTAGVLVTGQSMAASTSKSQCATGIDYSTVTQAELDQFDAN